MFAINLTCHFPFARHLYFFFGTPLVMQQVTARTARKVGRCKPPLVIIQFQIRAARRRNKRLITFLGAVISHPDRRRQQGKQFAAAAERALRPKQATESSRHLSCISTDGQRRVLKIELDVSQKNRSFCFNNSGLSLH
jgi:hypothetical protein